MYFIAAHFESKSKKKWYKPKKYRTEIVDLCLYLHVEIFKAIEEGVVIIISNELGVFNETIPYRTRSSVFEKFNTKEYPNVQCIVLCFNLKQWCIHSDPWAIWIYNMITSNKQFVWCRSRLYWAYVFQTIRFAE